MDEYDEHYGGPTDEELAKERKRKRRGSAKTKKMNKKLNHPNESESEKFVRTWQKCDSVIEVTIELGISRKYALAKANGFRRQGIMLKLFKSEVGR